VVYILAFKLVGILVLVMTVLKVSVLMSCTAIAVEQQCIRPFLVVRLLPFVNTLASAIQSVVTSCLFIHAIGTMNPVLPAWYLLKSPVFAVKRS
jgi:hypothetical protein